MQRDETSGATCHSPRAGGTLQLRRFAHNIPIINQTESTLREHKSPRKRFRRQHLATLATPTILRPASSEFPDGAIL